MISKTTTPPAYQEYTYNLNGNRNFQLMSHMARSLYFSVKFELWQNDNLPNNHESISRILKIFTADEVKKYLPEIMWDFEVIGHEIISLSLNAQKQKANERHEKAILAGKKSAQIRGKKIKEND